MTNIAAVPVSVSRRAAMGAGWIIAWRMATRNLGLLSTLILVRLLQPSDFGLVALAAGFISSVDALSAIGVQDALVRAPVIDRDLYDTGFGLSVLRGLLTAAVIAAIARPVGDFFNDSRLGVVMLALSAGTVISAFENIGIVDFRRDLAFRKEFDMQLWSRVASVAITIITAIAWHSYWALVVGILVNRTVRLVQSYVLSSYRPRFALRAWRRIIGFSLWTWAQTLMFEARDRSDSIVIGHLLGTGQVGLFLVGTELGSLPTTEIVEPLNRALFPGFAALHNAAEGLGKMFLNTIGIGFTLILPAGLGISMVADPMVRLALGPNWIAAVPVVQIIAVAGTAAIFNNLSGTLLNAIGRPDVTFRLMVGSTIVRMTCLITLVSGFGLAGGGTALAISALVESGWFLVITLPIADIPVMQLWVCTLRPVIATIAMVLLLWNLDMAWTLGRGLDPPDFVIDLFQRSALGAVSYVVVLLITWLAMGRPPGPEHFAFQTLGKTRDRVRRALSVSKYGDV